MNLHVCAGNAAESFVISIDDYPPGEYNLTIEAEDIFDQEASEAVTIFLSGKPSRLLYFSGSCLHYLKHCASIGIHVHNIIEKVVWWGGGIIWGYSTLCCYDKEFVHDDIFLAFIALIYSILTSYYFPSSSTRSHMQNHF